MNNSNDTIDALITIARLAIMILLLPGFVVLAAIFWLIDLKK